jgi:ADP-ribosylglycohydrolase
MTEPTPLQRFVIGAMVGDAIGLPFEGLCRRRVRAMLSGKPLGHRLVLGRGMVSDDTEHMLLTINAWRAIDGDPGRFAGSLAWRLRGWMLCVPPACGKATAIACVKLLVGVPPHRSGVRSAGNGPAMRAGALGLLAQTDEQAVQLVDIASRITHKDPRAIHGAMAVALAARLVSEEPTPISTHKFREAIEARIPDGQMRSELLNAIRSAQAGETTEHYADSLGCHRGVSGFVMHTVPVAIHAWLRSSESYETGIREIIELGGDTDTTAAILGGLLGLRHNPPAAWVERIRDFPVSVGYARRVAASGPHAGDRVRLLAMPLRNLAFLVVVLAHAARRLGPPYA